MTVSTHKPIMHLKKKQHHVTWQNFDDIYTKLKYHKSKEPSRMKQNWIQVAIFLSVICGASAGQANSILTVDDYLIQIKANNKNSASLLKQKEAFANKKIEAKLPLLPMFSASAQILSDQKETANPSAQGDHTKAQGISFGVEQQTDFGLKGRLNYQINAVEMEGTNPRMAPQGKFFEASPAIEVSQSLLKNAFGREIKFQQELVQTQLDSAAIGEIFKHKLLLLEGEMTYWRLAITREIVKIQAKTLQRSAELKKWAQRQWKVQLADKGDLLAASTAYKMREMEKESSLVDEKTAAAAFNNLRQISGPYVADNLQIPSVSFALNLQPPQRAKNRADVLAAEKGYLAAKIANQLNDEKFVPQFEVFAKFALNGRENKFADSIGESFTAHHPTAVIGLRFTAILGEEIIRQQKLAASLELEAKRLALERKQFEVEQEWNELNRKLNDAKQRLILSSEFEKALATKLTYEKSRQKIGRSTTFQVLSFEQEYLLSQLSSIRHIMEIIQIVSQMRLFVEEAP